jgi:hypothetical protein
MTEQEEKEFMEKNFPAGEFVMLQIMVRNENVGQLLEVLKAANLNLVIMPKVQSGIDFATDNFDGREH